MSTTPRCTVIVKLGMITTDSDPQSRAMRAICDRPKGHPGWQHKGRLVILDTVIGTIEWPRVAPK